LPFIFCHEPLVHATGEIAFSQNPAFWVILPGWIL
jgi:hypothetical protein